MRIVTARLYVGSGLDPEGGPAPGKFGRHRVVIDPREILPTIEEIVSRRHPGSTIVKGRGRWMGRGEPSLVVELWQAAPKRLEFFREVAETAREIMDALDQVAVAVVTSDAEGRQSVSYLGGAAASPRLSHRGRHRAAG